MWPPGVHIPALLQGSALPRGPHQVGGDYGNTLGILWIEGKDDGEVWRMRIQGATLSLMLPSLLTSMFGPSPPIHRHPRSPVTCHLSPVTCHLSPVTCHLSPGGWPPAWPPSPPFSSACWWWCRPSRRTDVPTTRASIIWIQIKSIIMSSNFVINIL